jgi:anti-sigma B factor antagonist
MDNISISLSESGTNRGISEVRIDGVIDTITAGEFEEVIESLLKRRRYQIIVDLAGVEYISSAGWGIFISHIKDVRSNDGDIKLAGMVPNVYEIYELLEFDNVLQAHLSVEEARDGFDSGSITPAREPVQPEVTRVTLVDGLSDPVRSPPSHMPAPATTPRVLTGDDVASAVLHMVKQDPFLTISEIKSEINDLPGSDEVGWWRVFSILKRNRLLTKRSRFMFARRRR